MSIRDAMTKLVSLKGSSREEYWRLLLHAMDRHLVNFGTNEGDVVEMWDSSPDDLERIHICGSMASLLMGFFKWSASKKGSEFWSIIHEKVTNEFSLDLVQIDVRKTKISL